MKNPTFVIDTNALLDDPYIVRKIEGEIVIPTTVLQELDEKKFGNTEKNRNAREFARIAEKGEIAIKYFHSHELPGSNDQKIIECVRQLRKDGKEVTLVTNDIYMSIMAKSYGIEVHKSDKKQHSLDESYSGIEELSDQSELNESYPESPNKYFVTPHGIFRDQSGKSVKRLGKDKDIWGIRHKSAEQRCAIDALMDDDIKLVTLSGRAGTGKTLLAIAAGLEKTIVENQYSKMLVSRPIVPMGNDLGFLPGDVNEKLGPWMQPIFDNIDFLFNVKGEKKNDNWMELERQGLLKLEPLTYIRGRSIPDQYIIIDEAQNLDRHAVKTILSRAGENTKIILTGDPDQIDNPKLDSTNNGLTYVIERFRNQPIAAHISLKKCERSELADISAEIL